MNINKMNILKQFTMAVLLALVSSQAVTDPKIKTPVKTTNLQSDFV